ncbi:MAG: hypothetical protein RL318_583 [Fibrobacterota bacterium]
MLKWLRRWVQLLLPPPRWQVPALVLIGLTIGAGGVIFHQSRAWSYLYDDPKACINCHIMMPQYTTWQHSSHARVASCNDCHVPHSSLAAKYFFKAKDGMRHATLFTLGMEEQVIRITAPSKAVVQENCVRCHGFVNDEVSTRNVTEKTARHGEGHLCWDCHREVPHGRVNSLSSVPNSRIQLETPTIPEWMRKTPKDGAKP